MFLEGHILLGATNKEVCLLGGTAHRKQLSGWLPGVVCVSAAAS